jgi:hypothetical protein
MNGPNPATIGTAHLLSNERLPEHSEAPNNFLGKQRVSVKSAGKAANIPIVRSHSIHTNAKLN